TGDSKPGDKAAGEPLAEWERDLLEGDKTPAEAAEAETPGANGIAMQTSAEPEHVADAEQSATPAVFAGAVFALFGLGLLVWTAVRARHRRPVYEGAAPGRSATVAASVAVASLALGLWCFSRV
ncbi:hypothetical protein, partial [Streptomyces albidoflavus]|uniref:hypothetical protein n=1 Tax=Streptomyces albidoflavus TaxID=1886 RepID=UPI00211CFEB2